MRRAVPPGERPLLASMRRVVGPLAASHALSIALPLLTIPYLARVLGPMAWAPVLVAQALVGWGTLVLEFAFDLSGVRALARSRAMSPLPGDRAAMVWGIVGAKLVLTPVVVAGLFGVARMLPMLWSDSRLVWAMVGTAVARGLAPMWYFQGEERLTSALAVDAASRIAPAVGVFLLVRGPADGWGVLALQAAGGAVALTWLLWRVRCEVAWSPGWRLSAVQALRSGLPLFLVRLVGALYAHLGTLWLGMVAAPVSVAAFGGAERVVRAGINLLDPVTRAYGARIAYLRGADETAAHRLLGRLGQLLGLGGLAGAILLWWQADRIIRVALGPEYPEAIPVLRVLVPLLPLSAVGTVLGPLRAMADGRDHHVLAAVGFGSAVGLSLMAMLTPAHGAIGMAIAIVSAEASVVAMLLLGGRRGPDDGRSA